MPDLKGVVETILVLGVLVGLVGGGCAVKACEYVSDRAAVTWHEPAEPDPDLDEMREALKAWTERTREMNDRMFPERRTGEEQVE